MHIYEELRVPAYINANEWYTSMGGSMLAAPVIAAMVEASRWTAHTRDLHRAVGDAIAELTQNEAACVTSSATAGIVLLVAACMSDLDVQKSEQLPDIQGLKADIVIHKCDRFGEDAAIKIPGARIVEIGDERGACEQDFRKALTDDTAAVFTTPPRKAMIPLQEMVLIAHQRGIPVIVDVAWSLPPKENLWKFTTDYDVDAVVISGGKGLRGPQGSGLILGKRAVVEACRNMMAPHCRIGRPMKIGRETLAGIYAAVKHFLNGGAEATQAMAEHIASELAGVPDISIRIDKPASHVYVDFSGPESQNCRDRVKQELFQREPRILVRDSGRSGIRVNAGTLSEGQERVVAARLKDALAEVAQQQSSLNL
jgi:L-seryl-tRNA(Ser) seleniumtransferase